MSPHTYRLLMTRRLAELRRRRARPRSTDNNPVTHSTRSEHRKDVGC
jgi:hypothetical protein